jgi:hypothetical protein
VPRRSPSPPARELRATAGRLAKASTDWLYSRARQCSFCSDAAPGFTFPGRDAITTALQFGAGNIGRGFRGQLFFDAGYETVLVEQNEELVRMLNTRGRCPMRLLDAASKGEIDMIIDKVRALSTDREPEIAATFAEAAVGGAAVGLASLERGRIND